MISQKQNFGVNYGNDMVMNHLNKQQIEQMLLGNASKWIS